MAQIESLLTMIGHPVQQVPIIGFVSNLFLATAMSYILAYVYVARGRALSNRRSLAGNFFLITVTTMFIITVVKSSLALSLGLVGALSIVRFRTAIKEPEELAYLFLTIAVGLGLGADQTVATIVAFVFIIAGIYARGLLGEPAGHAHTYFSVTGSLGGQATLDTVLSVLKRHCDAVSLKRYDESAEKFEGLFVADFDSARRFTSCREELRSLDKNIELQMIDNSM